MGSNLKVNLMEKKPDPKPIKSTEKEPEHKVIPSHKTQPDTNKTDHIKPKTNKTDNTKPTVPTGETTHEEEKVALILGITGVFSIWWYLIR